MRKPFGKVDVLVFDGFIAAEAFAIVDVLHMANVLAQRQGVPPPFDVSLVSIGGRDVRASAGPTLSASPPSRRADIVITPGFSFSSADDLIARLAQLRSEASLIKRTFHSNRAVASICVGAFLLAEAGVLNGREATTAWIVGGLFQRRYPEVLLDIDRLIVTAGRAWTTGAVTAAYDLALKLVREQTTAEFAALLSKVILVGHDRNLQSPFVLADLGSRSHSNVVARACHLMRRRVGSSFDLTALACSCATSKRTLNRRFRQELRCSPLQFFHRVKVERAKALLETTRMRISELPARLGYRDETTFRAIFARATGMTPARYRDHFRR